MLSHSHGPSPLQYAYVYIPLLSDCGCYLRRIPVYAIANAVFALNAPRDCAACVVQRRLANQVATLRKARHLRGQRARRIGRQDESGIARDGRHCYLLLRCLRGTDKRR